MEKSVRKQKKGKAQKHLVKLHSITISKVAEARDLEKRLRIIEEALEQQGNRARFQ